MRLRWMSNFTDVDALAAEPGVRVRFTRSPADVERADLVVVPGTKATVEDLERLRAGGPRPRAGRAARPRATRSSASAAATRCSASAIDDEVESRRGAVDGPRPAARPHDASRADKLLRRVAGTVALAGGAAATGYEIRHGRAVAPRRRAADRRRRARARAARSAPCSARRGTALLEGDAVRRALLAWVAARRGRRWVPGTEPFAAVRERHLDRLGDLIDEHVDVAALEALIEGGAPAGLPVVESGLVSPAR